MSNQRIYALNVRSRARQRHHFTFANQKLMNPVELQQALETRFDVEELRQLCFALGIKYENLSPQLSVLARQLVEHCQRANQIAQLIKECKESRPEYDDWGFDEPPDPPPPRSKLWQTMLVLSGLGVFLSFIFTRRFLVSAAAWMIGGILAYWLTKEFNRGYVFAVIVTIILSLLTTLGLFLLQGPIMRLL